MRNIENFLSGYFCFSIDVLMDMRYPQRRGKDEIEGNLKKLALAHLSLYVHCFVFLLLKVSLHIK